MTTEQVPTLEELQDNGFSLREATDDGAAIPSSRRIIVELSEREYNRIGGEKGLERLSDDVSDYVNDYISTFDS